MRLPCPSQHDYYTPTFTQPQISPLAIPPPRFCFGRPTVGITAEEHRVGVRRPTPRAGRTHQGYGEEEIRVWSHSFSVHLADEQVYRVHSYLDRKIFHFPPPHTAYVRTPPSQTDWDQDLEELLLSGGPTSVSHLRSPTLSAPTLDVAPVYDHPTSAPSCDQSIVEIYEDFDLDELLLRLTGHEFPSAFPLSGARNDPLSGLNPQVSPSMYSTIQSLPTVAFDLSSIYQVTPPFIAGFRSRQLLYHHPLPSIPRPSSLPCPEASPMPAQEPVLSSRRSRRSFP